jgi:hypothetical protein
VEKFKKTPQTVKRKKKSVKYLFFHHVSFKTLHITQVTIHNGIAIIFLLPFENGGIRTLVISSTGFLNAMAPELMFIYFTLFCSTLTFTTLT